MPLRTSEERGSPMGRVPTTGAFPFSLKEDAMENKRIECLYELLDRAIREHDSDAESSLRWAIFTLENYCGKS